MKKYDNKSNLCGHLIKKAREKKKLSKEDVCRQLQLHAVYIDRTELKRMEEQEMIIKDFELIALCIVLDIDYDEIKNTMID